MPSNVTLNSGSGGSNLYTKQVTHDGDTVQIQGLTIAGISGSEDSYTAVDIGAGNGTATNALRVTIASDSTGVLSVDDNGSTLSIDDGAGSITVDGTVTANLSATDNAVLDSIQTAVEIIDNAISGSEMQVDIVSGTVTANLSATDNAVLDSIVTNTANLTSAIVQDDSPFTPATGYLMMIGGEFDDSGTDSVDEGDAGNVRISGNRSMHVQIRDAAGNERGLNIDANGDLGVTNANLATLAGAVSGTEMQVDVVAALPTGSNTIGDVTVSGSALTALQLIDNSIFVDDAAFTEDSSSVSVAGAVRDDEVGSTAVVSADGDAGPLRMNQFGMLKTTQVWDATSEPKRAAIDAATSGDNTIVAAAGAGVKIRVLSLFLVAGGDVDVRFESGTGGTALTGQMDMTANSGIVLPYNPAGWFETADNTLLNIELSAAVSIDGAIQYVEV